jgi:hypothetical protein
MGAVGLGLSGLTRGNWILCGRRARGGLRMGQGADVRPWSIGNVRKEGGR